MDIIKSNDMDIACIIPARGGSKGLPGKNKMVLNGIPLVARSIIHAKLSKLVKRVFVSTDDKEIAKIALQFGAEVIWRPDLISGDEASSELALTHALNDLKESSDYFPDITVFLQCTAPIRTNDDIDNAIRLFIQNNYDSLLSVVPTHKFNWRITNKKTESINYDCNNRPRRQDRSLEYTENGSIYIFSNDGFLKAKNRLFGKIGLYVMDEWSNYEIDTENDFKICSWILGNINEYSNQDKFFYNNNLFPKIKLLVLDFDGVLTDNKVIISENGLEAVFCSRSDGFGISRILEKGIKVIVLSKEKNKVVQVRCEKLGIPCYSSVDDKLPMLLEIQQMYSIFADSIAYMGNDINDLECMLHVGISAAPKDADINILSIAKWISTKNGGGGAVREFCDFIIKNNLYEC